MSKKKKIVAVSGGFDPIHIGHVFFRLRIANEVHPQPKMLWAKIAYTVRHQSI